MEHMRKHGNGLQDNAEVAEIVVRAQEGDKEAFGDLYEMSRGYIIGLIRLASWKEDPELEDIIHEVFLRVLRKLHTLQDPAALRPWLRTVVRNFLINRSKRSNQSTTTLDDIDMTNGDDTPDVDAMAVEAHLKIHDLIKELPDIQRDTVVLFYQREFSITETAAELDVPVGTVKRRLHDARERMREQLRPYAA